MAGALVQSVQISYSTSQSSPSAPSMTTTAGNTLVVVAQCSASNSPTFNDGGLGDSFTSVVAAAEFAAGIKMFSAYNIAGGTTVVNGTGGAFYGLWVAEISGVTSTIYSAGQGQNGPGSSANAVSSGNITIANAPVFVVGLSYNATGTNTSNADTNPAAGTGFTGLSAIWNQHSGAGQNLALPAYGRILTTGSTPMTWTAATYGSDLYISVAAAFLESSGQIPNPPNCNSNYSMPMLAF